MMLRRSYLLLVIVLGGVLFLGTLRTPTLVRAGTSAHAATASIAPLSPLKTSPLKTSPLKTRPLKTNPLKTNPLKTGSTTPVTDKELCATCHEEQVASFDNTAHAKAWHSDSLPCATCHGDPTAHIEAGGGEETMISMKKDLSAKAASEVCLSCHEKTGEQSHIRLGEHTKAGVSCIECHNMHPDNAQKVSAGKRGKGSMLPANQLETCLSCHPDVAADISMPSRHRIKEGAMECSSCHNVHGTLQQRQVRAEGRDQCVKCHADKRGPFMFGHEAINLDGCVACHQPHGGPGKNMLKLRDQRALCLSCHSREIGKGVPHGRASATTMGDCTRCHSAVHGSNVDPYLLH